ncbi:hypothetical protein Pmani_014286 [Petrolisthes manimaculis]|uniref:Uncharacterized protein n=1 Tax=Petrolisthes manimaculis TaxID=1843537 RepID=A0AAE1PT73_9EUCA|nr:hypothetical protein Pmani_014286 [Petrolisthes manimaculis]
MITTTLSQWSSGPSSTALNSPVIKAQSWLNHPVVYLHGATMVLVGVGGRSVLLSGANYPVWWFPRLACCHNRPSPCFPFLLTLTPISPSTKHPLTSPLSPPTITHLSTHNHRPSSLSSPTTAPHPSPHPQPPLNPLPTHNRPSSLSPPTTARELGSGCPVVGIENFLVANISPGHDKVSWRKEGRKEGGWEEGNEMSGEGDGRKEK